MGNCCSPGCRLWCLSWCLFVLFFFPRGVLDEILNLIVSVSEGFPSYSYRLIESLGLGGPRWLGSSWQRGIAENGSSQLSTLMIEIPGDLVWDLPCVQQASCLEGGPLLWIWPLYLHVNQKSDDDDDRWSCQAWNLIMTQSLWVYNKALEENFILRFSVSPTMIKDFMRKWLNWATL